MLLPRYYRRGSLAIAMFCLNAIYPSVQATEQQILFDHQPLLSSSALVRAVLTRNPDIPAMQASLQAARSRIEIVESFDDPKLSWRFAPQTLNAENMGFGQQLSLSQRLPWPGKRNLRGDIARAEADAALIRVDEVRLRLTQSARNAFADWHFVHAAIEINQINQTLLKEFQNIAEIKYSSGRASRQDVLSAEVERVKLEHKAIVLEREKREIMARINALLQRLPDQPVPPPQALSSAVTLPDISSLRELALQRYPQLRALTANIRASHKQQQLAARNNYPDITVSATYNSLWNQREKQLTLGASINIPLSGKHRAAIDQARAQSLRLNAQQSTLKAKLLSDLQRAVDQLRESKHVLALYQDRLLPLAEENLQAAQSAYESGDGGFLDLINAEKNLTQTRLQQQQTNSDYHKRLATLEQLVGSPLTKNTGDNPHE